MSDGELNAYIVVVDDQDEVFEGIKDFAELDALDGVKYHVVHARGASRIGEAMGQVPMGSNYFMVIDMIMEDSSAGMDVCAKLYQALELPRYQTGFQGAVIHSSLASRLSLDTLRRQTLLGSNLDGILAKVSTDGQYGSNVVEYVNDKLGRKLHPERYD